MTGEGFGTCVGCDRPAVVKLNGRPFCMEHYDGAMAAAGRMLRRALELLEADPPKG